MRANRSRSRSRGVRTGGGIDISAFNFSLWNREYAGASPWVGKASGGTSGTHDLTEAAPPGAGATLNGKTTADFNGTTQHIDYASSVAGLFTSTAGSVGILFNADTLTADAANNNDNDPKLWGDSASFFALKLTTGGAQIYIASGTVLSPAVSVSTGVWTAVFAKWDASKIYIAKNSAGFDAGTAASFSIGTGSFRIGCNFNASTFFDGRIAEVVASPTVLSDSYFAGILADWNAFYALSL